MRVKKGQIERQEHEVMETDVEKVMGYGTNGNNRTASRTWKRQEVIVSRVSRKKYSPDNTFYFN